MRRSRTLMMTSGAMLLALAAQAGSVGGARNIWFHQVPRVKQAPVIDGKRDDACWKRLPVLSNFGRDRYSLKSKHPMIPMTMQLGFDDTYLYALWVINNPEGEHGVDYGSLRDKQEARMHDAAMYWNHPSVEFRIDGRRDRLGETAIQMNLVGQKQAMQLIATGWSREYTAGWDIWADYDYVPSHDDSAWWTELKVSIKDMGAAARPGYVMGAQFRYFHPGAYFAWTPGGYEVARYGDLLLVEEPLPTENALAAVCPDYRSAIIRMPQPDKVVVVAEGEVSEIPYKDTIMDELNAVKQERGRILEACQRVAALDGAKVIASVDKQIAEIEKDVAEVKEFRAHDLMRLRQPLDVLGFSLREARARAEIHALLAKSR